MSDDHTWTNVGILILILIIGMYLLIQEGRYQQCVGSWMQNPYMTEALARQVCK